MNVKIPVFVFLASIIVINCYGSSISTTLETATASPIPRKKPTSTITPTFTETPYPTSIRQATISAFENLLKNVCPTTTPNPAQGTNTSSFSDNEALREFAGKYSKSSGFWIFDLVLNCDGTFYEITLTDIGSVFIDQGNVEVQDGKLLFKLTNRGEPLTIEYIPLRWGQRKYLIYADTGVESFCEAMASDYGKEPRNEESIIGLFYLRIGDEKLNVEGLPIFPNSKEICK